jgi:membrane-bound lytic murein transglycosylase B
VTAGVFAAILAALAAAIGGGPAAILPSAPPAARPQLQGDLDLAQQIIDDPASAPDALVSAGQFEQLATRALADQRVAAQRATLAGLSAPATSAMRVNLQAAAALTRLVTPRKALPRWRVIQPPMPDTLLAFFRAAQARFGVPWEYLAAIEFVETKFGRVAGLSTAGAEGPMQFLPATWARYGRGNVHDPRDAVFGAARYLVANGAPGHMAGALYHYNPSRDYVRAITDYAGWMRSDPRAYYGYYGWQVIYARRGGEVILPVGYPRARPVPLP